MDVLPRILMTGAECAPFAKTGGLADVIGTLTRELHALGFDIRLMLPFHRVIKDQYRENVRHIASFSVDLGWRSQYAGIELAKGPMICISPILSKAMSDKLISVAKEKNIPFQYEPISGTTGTNADHISVTKSGVASAVVSIPQRYMHTPIEVIDISDVENTAALLAEYIIGGGAFND